MNKIAELFTISGYQKDINWIEVCSKQHCSYLNRKCLKNRKSQADISIGTCTVKYGAECNVIICPYRLLERKQIFMDCLHLLTAHEPGNELHLLSEISIPGGNVDYFIVSTDSDRNVKDFIGIELQTLDTTGTVWPERQRFLKKQGIKVNNEDSDSVKSFGMNWKMTAKTILVQLHHKIDTFECLNKHLVLIVQDCFLDYIKKNFHLLIFPKMQNLENPCTFILTL
ncbi:Restriction endonuclease NotI [Bacteroidales bacterium Barb7]|nr:Restriction endonuclease NotI [Bacteroidales bacterium Barb7]